MLQPDQSTLRIIELLARRVRPAFEELLPRGERVVAAVSGGADSLALLWLLRHFNCDVIVAHINHDLRGAESDGDEAFVVELCRQFELPVVVRRVELAAAGSMETAARSARYKALVDVAGAQRCTRVATGHTANDQLETVLLNWLRGAGIAGLRGMEPVRELAPDVLLVRPMLPLTREDTMAICNAAQWAWREDSSNQSTLHRRNRVRHELLPSLRNVMNGDEALEQLARQTVYACDIWRADLELLDDLAREKTAAITLREEATPAAHLLVLDGLQFRKLPLSMQRRVLRRAAEQVSGTKYFEGAGEVGREKIETTRRQVLSDGRRAVWQWTRNLWVEWTGAAAGNRIRVRRVNDEVLSTS
ncbi:MAG: tRNA(Ile)-lysidine synthase [Abditibacteriota bacterium]|nr:tRNA(Ile)-lysidine synthase [Abditibacteriota bacterium]